VEEAHHHREDRINEILFTITLVTSIFVPANFIAGVVRVSPAFFLLSEKRIKSPWLSKNQIEHELTCHHRPSFLPTHNPCQMYKNSLA
jgi:hypothetical protein